MLDQSRCHLSNQFCQQIIIIIKLVKMLNCTSFKLNYFQFEPISSWILLGLIWLSLNWHNKKVFLNKKFIYKKKEQFKIWQDFKLVKCYSYKWLLKRLSKYIFFYDKYLLICCICVLLKYCGYLDITKNNSKLKLKFD